MVVRDLVAASYSHGDLAIDKGLVEGRIILNFFGSDEKLRQEGESKLNWQRAEHTDCQRGLVRCQRLKPLD